MKYSIQLLNCQHDCTYHLLWRLETFILTADIFAKDSIMSDDILVFPREYLFCVKVSVGS